MAGGQRVARNFSDGSGVMEENGNHMKLLLSLLLWSVLLVLCWPLAFLVLLAWPVLWLLSIPFRIVGTLMNAILALVSAILHLPARLLGGPGSSRGAS